VNALGTLLGVARRGAARRRRLGTLGVALIGWRIARRIVTRSPGRTLRFEVRPGETYLIRGIGPDR
jgi:hypothetical protein